MNEQIQIFKNPQFGQIRTAGTPDEPLFCLTDVCRAVELDPSQVARRLDKGVLSKHTLDTAGGQQLVNFVNEDGLYDVILDSRKPEAKAFRKWVTSEVLPTIRKTGGYMISKPQMPTFDQLPTAVYELQKSVNYLVSIVENMAAQPQTTLIAPSGKGLVLGRFVPGEQIRMCDKRLFNGPGAPFKSYQQVLHAKRRGCPFHRPDNVRIWTISTEDLEGWLNLPRKHKPILNW